jgi:DNA topoisomerase-3
LKENGIGRPSSRAGIIETLFKRHYIRRERKRLVATATGIELIGLIHEKLLTSCELTGIWEKKLRDIEHHKYEPAQFIAELKEQIMQIVNQVLCDNTNRRITLITEDDTKKKKTATKKKATTKKAATKKTAADSLPADDSIIGKVCPICGKGTIIKGKTAYGCSNWKEGCKFRIPRS